MLEARLPFLADWQNFYMITGAAAATLTGLMFIVVTLMAGIERQVSTLNAGLSAFTTPSMVHFCTVLGMAMLLSVPWQALWQVSIVLGLLGLGEVAYFLAVARRMRRVPGYQTPGRDWLWYLIVPLGAHIALVGSAVMLPANPGLALFFIGAVMVALLFVGIRNAWDLLTFLAVERSHPDDSQGE